MTKSVTKHGMFSSVQQRINYKDIQNCLFACFLSQAEPKKVIQELKDPRWIEAMQEELLQFKNKKDERSIVIRNKAKLVTQGYTQEEGIDYDEVFAPVASIEAIRLFLAYASFKDFVVYQMDVKSAFLYGKIEEEFYVCQPLGFEDPEFHDRVYKVEKALYGLHQAPRAWYETLSTYLLDNGFQKGKIDKTLFIKRVKGDILLVQVYVDDIIFGSTKKSLCTEFEKLMHKKFQMSCIASTPMETSKSLMKDENAEDVDVTPKVSHLHAMKRIFRFLKGQPKLGLWKSTTRGCLFLGRRLISWQCKKQTVVANSTTEAKYVAASSCCGHVLWIQNQLLDYGYNFMNTKIFIDNESTICIVKNPVFHSKTKHIEIRHHFIRDSYEKRLIQIDDWNGLEMLRMKLVLKLVTVRVTTAEENADFDEIVDFLNANPIRYALTVSPTIYVSYIEQFWSTAKIKIVNNERQIRAKVNGKTIVISESSVRRDLQFNDEDADETIYEERGDSMERVATTAASLDAEQDSGVNTPGSGEDRLKIMELMEICTKLSDRVLALENVKTAQDLEITSLKKRVKKLEKKKKARTPQLKRRLFKVRIESSADKSLGDQEDASKQGRNIAESDQDEEISFVQEDAETQGRYDQDIDVTTVSAPITTAGVSVSTAEPSTPPTTTTTVIEDEDLTIAQILMKKRSEKLKEKVKERGSTEKSSEPATRPTRGVTMQEPSESGTRKAIKFDEEVAKRLVEELEAELEEEERVTIQREEEANLISWDNTQAMMEADYELAQRLQVEEHGELTIEERYKHTQLKNKSFEEIQMLFDKEIKRVNSFVPMDSEVVEGSGKKTESSRKETVSKKRAGEELDEESVKRQKLEDDAKKAEL
ncbi:putative ribonuclease H-like domain-containing protein [Tanacetum coccineum]